MKPAAFRYLAPRSEDELMEILREHGSDARLLAGGQSLVPMMNFRLVAPTIVVDINRIGELAYLRCEQTGIELGALTRHVALEDSAQVRERFPVLAEGIRQVAHRAVRNRGTMGGSLALAYPGAELPLIFVTLAGEVCLRSPSGERRVPTTDFITGALETVLAEDEYICSARIPSLPPGAGSAFVEVSRRHGDFALAASAAVVVLDEHGRIRLVHAGITGGIAAPVRLPAVERALVGAQPTDALLDEAARDSIAAIDVESDHHYPRGYRRMLLATVLHRALMTAVARVRRSHVH
jgi:aerobic carbon-monoxide dehydrogenase medium subunit